MTPFPGWAMSLLACPRDGLELASGAGGLRCADGHHYPVIDGIPILLLEEVDPTQPAYWATRQEVHPTTELPAAVDGIDEYVRLVLLGTSGNLYRAAGARLDRYPIPVFPSTDGRGRVVVDVGSNWGRWCVAAARAGFRPIGVDPSLGAVRAARRVVRQLGVEAAFAVADGRYLPFRAGSIEKVFSYSVLQHFSKEDARTCLRSVGRVLVPGGEALIQMAGSHGPWNLAKQSRAGFREATRFDVRYWSAAELRAAFGDAIGPASLLADGYFSLNPQAADLDLLTTSGRIVVTASGALCRLSRVLPPLVAVADSVFVRATKPR